MKAVFVIDSLAPGGAEHSLYELLGLFRANGIAPTVICLKHGLGSLQASAIASGFDVRTLSKTGRLGRVRAIRETLRKLRPDLVHTSLFESDVSGRVAATGLRIPLISSLVNTSYDLVRLRDPNIDYIPLTASRLVDGWSARHLTDRFHAISNTVKWAAVRDLKIRPDRVTVIPRGRDPGRFGEPSIERRIRARAALGVPSDVPVLATLGRQEFQKGHRYLLDALPRIRQSHEDTVLLLAGREGNASEDLGFIAKTAHLDGHARILGHREDVPEVLAAADVFVFPSLYEGLGGALIEAMALGLPIVASDLPAIREVVDRDRNALLVRPGSPTAIASAVDRLLSNPAERASMSRKSRQIFLERFTLERSGQAMVELLRTVARPNRSLR